MQNFTFHNPTKIFFGEGQIQQVAKAIPADAKVLMLYGGGSIKSNGVYDQVSAALSGHTWQEFGGIEPNPQYQTLLKAVSLIKAEGIDFLLAVGGGSVIDGVKFIAAAALYAGDEPWEMYQQGQTPKQAMPFGSVLTLPATGSEMNSVAVVSRAETGEKLPLASAALYPQFSVCDPTVVRSIPPRQLANGIADAFTHVLEQYLTYPADAYLQDRFAEGIMQTLVEIAPRVMADPSDYPAAANFMWCATMALNGLIAQGVPTDWSVHMIGHELTAQHGIDHARTLAVVLASAYTYRFEQKKAKLAQYGSRVWGLTEADEGDRAKAAITRTEAFFHELGIKTRLRDYTEAYQGSAEKVAEGLIAHHMTALGEHRDLTPDDAKAIVEMAY
jgi:NADP-dependent alcohol dehydrogenase